jgi:sugar O-acyltransferase (sialic acid O-acetyltransferase NeuD family)
VNSTIIFGAGGFGIEIASYLKDLGQPVHNIIDEGGAPRIEDMKSVLGPDLTFHNTLESLSEIKDCPVIIALGDPALRQKVANKLLQQGFTLGRAVHPSAYVASSARVQVGCIVAPFAFVGPFAKLGFNAAVNVRASVGHDACVEAHCVLSPHVALNGNTHCGEAAFFGAGAIMLPGTRLGPYSKVSAGSVIKGDFPAGFLLHGNPAKGRQMFALP